MSRALKFYTHQTLVAATAASNDPGLTVGADLKRLRALSLVQRPSLSISLRQTICALLLMRVPVYVPDSPSQLPFNLEYAKKGCEPWRKRLHGRWKARQTKDKLALLWRRPWQWLWQRRFLTTKAAWIQLIPLVIPLVFTGYTAKCTSLWITGSQGR